MSRRALAVAAALGATLAVSACSGGAASDGAPAPGSASPAAATPPVATPATVVAVPSVTPGGSGSPGALATLPVTRCLTGRYVLARFVASGDGATYGTGQGGDVSLTFDDDRYTLAGAGREPVVVTLAGQTGDLTVDGAAKGGWTLDGSAVTFTSGSATGSGTLDDGSGGERTRLTMKQVDGVIGLAGRGQVACTAQAMTITLSTVRLELARA